MSVSLSQCKIGDMARYWTVGSTCLQHREAPYRALLDKLF